MKDKSADGERDVHERQAEAEKACRGTSVLGQRGAAKQKGDLCTGTSGKLAETPDTREGCGQNTREHAGGKSRKRARSDQNKCRRHHLRPRGLRTHNPRLFALTPRFGRLLALKLEFYCSRWIRVNSTGFWEPPALSDRRWHLRCGKG